MPEKPIIMSADSVNAIIARRKTMTRRVCKGVKSDWDFESLDDHAAMIKVDRHGEQYPAPVKGLWATFHASDREPEFPMVKSPYQIGDLLWVKETWAEHYLSAKHLRYEFRADFPEDRNAALSYRHDFGLFKWKSPLFMPKATTRIWLRVTGVRVERLQEIMPEDLRAEGMKMHFLPNELTSQFNKLGAIFETNEERKQYQVLWDALNAKRGYPWSSNCYVWVYTFERVDHADTP